LASTSSSTGLTPAQTARRLSLGLPLRQANEIHSSDDDSKNGLGSPTSPTGVQVGTGVGE
jgi:tripartite motif-containing protein 71